MSQARIQCNFCQWTLLTVFVEVKLHVLCQILNVGISYNTSVRQCGIFFPFYDLQHTPCQVVEL